ncbi:MAG TPA: hypothetical protein VGJ00_05030 [Rhabdochlamydiaceae bacterium]|jgi:hypothetical protein
MSINSTNKDSGSVAASESSTTSSSTSSSLDPSNQASLLSLLFAAEILLGQVKQSLEQANFAKDANGAEQMISQILGNGLLDQEKKAYDDMKAAEAEQARQAHKSKLIKIFSSIGAALAMVALTVATCGAGSAAIAPIAIALLTTIPVNNGETLFGMADQALGDAIGSQLAATFILGGIAAIAGGGASALSGARTLATILPSVVNYSSQTLLAAGLPAQLGELAKTDAGKMSLTIFLGATLALVGVGSYVLMTNAAQGVGQAAELVEQEATTSIEQIMQSLKRYVRVAGDFLERNLSRLTQGLDKEKVFKFAQALMVTTGFYNSALGGITAKNIWDSSDAQFTVDQLTADIAQIQSRITLSNDGASSGQQFQNIVASLIGEMNKEGSELAKNAFEGLQALAQALNK